MGSCFSRSTSCSISGVRVVHLSGYVEDFQAPITAKEVIGGLPTHFLCTMSHIVQGSRSIRPEVQLETGCIYFLLPYTVLGSDTSPVDLVALGSRLSAIARSDRASCKVKESVLGVTTSKGDLKAHNRCPFQKRVDGPTGVRTWKPILECIIERSMERSASMDVIR